MYFMVKEWIFLHFFCLFSGKYSYEPRNKIHWIYTKLAFFECPYSQSPINMTWTMWPVGGQRNILITTGDSINNSDFNTVDDGSREFSDVVINNATVSTAGVYNCEQDTTKSAQLIVIVEGTKCYLNPKQTETRSLREATSQSWSCAVKLAANASYVSVNMSWSIRGGTSEPPRGSMEQSTSANITEIRSTLNVTVPENDTCFVSIYECHVTLGMKDNLPSGFATNTPVPVILPGCSPNSDNCGLQRTSEKPFDKSSRKPDDKPDKKPDKKPDEEPDKQSTKKPKIPGDKSGEGVSSDSPWRGRGLTLFPRSDGLAVKSSKENDFLKCVVGIAGFLLIVTGIVV